MSNYPPPPPPPSQPGGYPGSTGPGPSGHPSGPRAGFWIRFAAALIDAIILGVVGSLLRFGVGIAFGGLLSLIVDFAYFGYFEGGPAGQTVGKMALGIRVVRAADGGPIGWGTALLRHLCSFVSAIPCGLGYFWMLWDPEKQTWHDKWTNTLEVPSAAWPPPPASFGKPPVS